MSLSSVFSTATSGMQASETLIDVAGNNVANANTVGFKASTAEFATQFAQTLSLGTAPSSDGGGSNPIQTGLGVQVASVTPDFTQGTLETTSNSSDLAIQGNGFFTVQSASGQQLYTRNGQFQLNAENQLTDSTGDLVMGYGVDANFNIQSTQLQALNIPLGSTAVARATQNVTLQGTLSATGTPATTAQIIQTQALGDASFTSPPGGATASLADTSDYYGYYGHSLNDGRRPDQQRPIPVRIRLSRCQRQDRRHSVRSGYRDDRSHRQPDHAQQSAYRQQVCTVGNLSHRRRRQYVQAADHDSKSGWFLHRYHQRCDLGPWHRPKRPPDAERGLR